MTKKLIAAAAIALLALTGCSTATVAKPDTKPAAEEPAQESAPEEGTRKNPYPIGSAVTDGDWTVTINSVTLNANDAITAENMFNDAPADGTQYLMVNLTATYNGAEADGMMPMLTLEYVTADGNTINSYDAMIVPPEQFDSLSTLYEGASTTGNLAFAVPAATAGDGVLALRADMVGDKVFVAVQ